MFYETVTVIENDNELRLFYMQLLLVLFHATMRMCDYCKPMKLG